MGDTTPHRFGKNAQQILSDYENSHEYERISADGRELKGNKRWGAPEIPVIERLMARTDIVSHPDFELPCKLFDGTLYTDCYRQIWYHGKYVRIHRLALILDGQTLTPNAHVDHMCEHKNCWEITHLEETTPDENTRRYWKRR